MQFFKGGKSGCEQTIILKVRCYKIFRYPISVEKMFKMAHDFFRRPYLFIQKLIRSIQELLYSTIMKKLD